MSWGTTGPLTTIYIFDLDGGLINNFGCFGTDDSEFQRIQGITVGACGNIYAVDPFLGRINVFDDNGNYITKFGTHGDGVGEFNLPMDIIFTSDNRAFVSSMNKGAIDVFSITPEICLKSNRHNFYICLFGQFYSQRIKLGRHKLQAPCSLRKNEN